MPRALFYLHRAPNLQNVLPLVHVMRRTGGWEAAAAVTPWDPVQRVGLPPEYEQRLHKLGLPLVEPAAFRPDVTLTQDPVEGMFEGLGLRVRMPAGLIGKGLRYGAPAYAPLDNLADAHLVPGSWHARRMQREGVFTPVSAVGLPSLDPLLGNWMPPGAEFKRQLRLDPATPVILFAPTWNPELSSVPLLWTRVARLADAAGAVLMVRLHPYQDSDAVRAFSDLADRHDRVMIAREPDVHPYLRMADVLVSDVSSIAFEAAVVGTPVVLVDNPNRVEYPDHDAQGAEHALRDIGPRVTDLEGLTSAVRELLAGRDVWREARENAALELVEHRDGHSAERLLREVAELLQSAPRRTAEVRGRVRALVPVGPGEEVAAGVTLEALLERGGEAVTAFVLDRGAEADAFQRWRTRWPGRVETVASPGGLEQVAPGARFTVLARPGVDGRARWLMRTLNHLRREPGWEAVVPLLDGGSPAQDPRVRLSADLAHGGDIGLLDRELSLARAGERATTTRCLRSDLVGAVTGSAAERSLLEALAEAGEIRWNAPAEAAVALDVLCRGVDAGSPKLAEGAGPLGDEERERAEARVAELAEWVGRLMPEAGRDTVRREAPGSNGGSSAGSGSGPGRLRLAMHYEAKGKLEEAALQVRRALDESPEDPDVRAMAARLGVVHDAGSGVVAGSGR